MFVFIALLYLFECLNEGRQHFDRLQLSETSVGNVIWFRKRRIMTTCGSLHFCLLDPPVFNGVAMLPFFNGVAMFDRK